MTDNASVKAEIPVLPLRDIVVFPGMTAPLFAGRPASIRAIEKALAGDRKIMVVAQKDGRIENPDAADLYETGTLCQILQVYKVPDGTVKVLVEGKSRAKATYDMTGAYVKARPTLLRDKLAATSHHSDKIELVAMTALDAFEKWAARNKKIPEGLVPNLQEMLDADPISMGYSIISHLDLPLEDKQKALEIDGVLPRLEHIAQLATDSLEALESQARVDKRVKAGMEKTQREYVLRQQMKAIREELGETDEEDPVAEYQARIDAMDLPPAILEKAMKELKKLKVTSPQSAEATVLRNYLDALLDYPWGKRSNVNNDLTHARRTLDEDHYGLEKVKKQVLENLAVQARLDGKGLSDDAEADILCLVGPPGVGKTSICKSLAKATGREYVRMAVGGVRDEAEIRGHRRTYIGSKPGRIVQKITEAGKENCLFVIDEIDKMGHDPHRGDPAAAMLEVLDPEQNDSFEDHYLEVPIDLSGIKFVCTANVWANIPVALQDRMETIFLGSYTEDEKLEIAKQHLLRKQRKAHGLSEEELKVSDEALRDLVRYYTKESGVRTLQREIKNLCRKAVVALSEGQKSIEITPANLEEIAGKHKYKYDLVEAKDEIGVVTGLAYTSVGGETLPIEAEKWPEKGGKFIYTGSLGDVMKESIQVAEGWLKAKAGRGEIKGVSFEDVMGTTFRVHVPEGAVPKDGPSAGAAMLTAVFSVAAGKPVRRDVAMTGELSLRGKVTAIGGVREKLSAAARGGFTTVLIPAENVKDLDEVPQQVKDALIIRPVSTIEEVLKYALVDGENLFAEPANDVMPAPAPAQRTPTTPHQTAAPIRR